MLSTFDFFNLDVDVVGPRCGKVEASVWNRSISRFSLSDALLPRVFSFVSNAIDTFVVLYASLFQFISSERGIERKKIENEK